MSTVSPTPAAGHHNASQATQQAKGNGKAGAQGPNGKADASGQNLFANLLQLLSATPDAAGLSLGADDAATGNDASPTDALLAGTDALAAGLLPGWMPQPLDATPPGTGQALTTGANTPGGAALGELRPGALASGLAATGADPLNPALAKGPTTEGGISIAGMAPVAAGEPLPSGLNPATAAAPDAAAASQQPPLNTETPPTGAARPVPAGATAVQWRSTVTSTAGLQRQSAPAGSVTGLGASEAPTLRATAELLGQHPTALRTGMGWEARPAGSDPATSSTTGGVGGIGAAGSAPAGGALGSGAGGTGGQDGQALADGPAADAHTLGGTDTTEDADALAYASEAEEASAAPWGAGSLQQANLRVGEAQDAIDIQLAMNGQELRVDFRTDNAQARESLAQHASESLGELLQRSGIELADVSVGAQTQQHTPGQPTPQDSAAQRSAQAASANQRATSAGAADPNAAPAPRRARTEGGLDLFV